MTPRNSVNPPRSAEEQAVYDAALERRLAEKAMNPPLPQPVVVIDVNIRFWSMVWLLVKLTFAGIPAMLIVMFIVYIAFLALGHMFHVH
ncbi:MAG: hypothetical protein RKO25_05665 [Candidatus Contendobacter sp.]|nr:hypothetical protein [Candidatus Contendobacter sp.]